MIELWNFGHMNTFTIQFESREKKIIGDVMDINYDVMNFISKYLCFKKAYKHFHNIFRLFDVLSNFALTTMCDDYL